MKFLLECGLAAAAFVMLVLPKLLPPPPLPARCDQASQLPSALHATMRQNTITARPPPCRPRPACNIRAVEAGSFGSELELAAMLAASPEPVLVRGFAARLPSGDGGGPSCGSVESCISRYSELVVGVSTGGAIGEHNPER